MAQAIEYLLLALLQSAVALMVGGGAGWVVDGHVLDLPWLPDSRVVAGTLAAACAVTLGIGMVGSIPALRERTASALRALSRSSR